MRAPLIPLLGLALAGCRQDVSFVTTDTNSVKCVTVWYGDADGDGYGGTLFELEACEQPSGYVDNADDCDDLEPAQNPGEQEICGDGLDNDCSGDAEEACTDLIEDGVAIFGEQEGEGGFELASGDLNGDGTLDLVVSAPGRTNGDEGAEFDGAVALFLGPHTADRSFDEADALILGISGEKQVLGYAISVPGDIDGDGLDDLVVTGTQTRDDGNVQTGSVATFSATTLLGAAEPLTVYDGDDLWFGAEKRDFLGASLAVADIDGAVTIFSGASGAEESRGAVYRLSDTEGLDNRLLGIDEDDRIGLGQSIAAGDLDGDGVADLAVGAYFRSNDDGEVYLCAEPIVGDQSLADCPVLVAEGTNDQLGERMASAGDVDGDGLTDLWVGAPSRDGEFIADGAAYLVSGRTDLDTLDSQTIKEAAQAWIIGVDNSDQIGSALAPGADLDGDGAADALIGAEQLGQIKKGVALLFYGPLDGAISAGTADAAYTSEGETDRAGDELALLPELDALFIDAPESDRGNANAGTAWIVDLSAP